MPGKFDLRITRIIRGIIEKINIIIREKIYFRIGFKCLVPFNSILPIGKVIIKP